ncbi:hypothetical protein [Actinophytocola gossypii]|uniref:Uncharacterized protein n=1 Tax=Actinophytocola gossypii TaxID=2812003 RepID=A0ABT2JFV3_9PSEU|nr:hypothetical protein [Actinophytocola gossypii]MCT2586760.1 hypothetical protein [Actinophytocola gossypii]
MWRNEEEQETTPVEPTRGERVVEHLLRHTGDVDLSTDEIMALTRGEPPR